MNSRSLYPLFYPLDWISFLRVIIWHLKSREILLAVKKLGSVCIRYIIPRAVGWVISPFTRGHNRKNIYLRLDLDHFGPIIYLYSFVNSTDYDQKSSYYVLCCQFENENLLDLFPSNIIFIKRPIFWVLISPLFFTAKKSYLIYPFVRDYQLKVKREIKGLDPLLENTAELKFRSVVKIPAKEMPGWLNLLLKGRKYIILFNREPGWHASISRSMRNIDLDNFKELLEYCRENNLAVIRLGGSYLRTAEFYGLSDELIIDYPHTKYRSSENDLIIWQHCEAVIGSVSGATHVPSIIFGKPVLYIGILPLHHIFVFHGLIYKQGTIPDNVFYAPTPVRSFSKIVSMNHRLEREYILGDPYRGLEIENFDGDTIKNLGEFFMQKIGLLTGDNQKVQRLHLYSIQTNEKNLEYRIDPASNYNGQILIYGDKHTQ